MSPTLLIVLVIVVFPLLWAILMSFQRLRLIEIGRADFFRPLTLANYQRVLASDALWTSLGTTLVYTVGSVVLSISLGLLAAIAVRRPFRGRTFVRAAFLLPYVAPVVAVTFIWRTMLNPQFGIVNEFGQNRVRLGAADRLPVPGHEEPGTARPGDTGADRPARRYRVRGLALLPVRLPVPDGPARGDVRRGGGGGASRRRRPRGSRSVSSCCPS